MLAFQTIWKFCLFLLCGLLMTSNLKAQKLPDSIVTYYYPEGGDSVNGVKIMNEYNVANQMTSHSVYNWNTISKQWDGWAFCDECSYCTGRYEYKYDDAGNQVLSYGYGWQEVESEWVNRSRTENNLDYYGNTVSIIISGWNDAEKVWTPNFGYEFEYDEVGHIISRITVDRSPPLMDWHPLEKMLYTFDSYGNKVREIRQLWSDTIRDWINNGKTEWYFDSLGITTGYSDSFRWVRSGINGQWELDVSYKTVNESDQLGNRVITIQSMKFPGTPWTPIIKEERGYNPSGQPIISVIREGTGTLTEKLRTEWVYSPAGMLIRETQTGNIVRLRKPDCFPRKRKLKVIRSFDADGDIGSEIWYQWNAYDESFVPDRKDYHFYHSTPTGQQETGIETIRVYPNPTGGILNFAGLPHPIELKVYTMQGALLRSFHQVVSPVDISGLTPGIYLIQISTDNHQTLRTILPIILTSGQ